MKKILLILCLLAGLVAGAQTGSVTDIDGNTYKTVTIAGREWMAENLKVTHYPDGTEIPTCAYKTNIPTTSNFEYYWPAGGVDTNIRKWGCHYTYLASLKACPTGWELPSDTDYLYVFIEYGMKMEAGKAMKSLQPTTVTIPTEYWVPNASGNSTVNAATNASGYNAIGSGFRAALPYKLPANNFNAWCSGQFQFKLEANTDYAYLALKAQYKGDANYGYSVRCIKSIQSPEDTLTTGINTTVDYAFSFWPNPVGSELSVELPESAELSIYNVGGQLILVEKLQAGISYVDTGCLPSGTYLLVVRGKSSTTTERLIKK